MNDIPRGGFTLPGEAGYEELTLELAKRFGADVIRDSDGTVLSESILKADYKIYSTLCVIREHNEFLRKYPQYQQQCFLMSQPVTADGTALRITLLKGYSNQQFKVNSSPESTALWQVFDRTEDKEVPHGCFIYDEKTGIAEIKNTVPWHSYTVNFLAHRIWEEISMYNYLTNGWTGEHLMQLDPVYPQVQEYLCNFLENWCKTHSRTNVVRFTSLFYNFVWIWGSRKENLYTDWAAYDFTVSPHMMSEFAKQYGYELTSEDFINKGIRHSCHLSPDSRQRDYISFVNGFITGFGKKLVDIVHKHGKEAYLFYDDSWVGTEPCGDTFEKFGFDGIIKCVFSGFEARLCAAVDGVKTHEIRLHPYLFPVGLGGAPTFADGGQPGRDALLYWSAVRRALLRKPVDRIGLGGYLHLTQQYPDFLEAMDKITGEFAQIKELHKHGKPQSYKCRIGIATSWGRLRRWTCGGHYHEHPELDLLNLLESLAGLPFEVEFFSLEELSHGVPYGIDIIINAGFAGSAWSGGDEWKDAKLVQSVTRFVHEGGLLLGVGEPSAVQGSVPVFKLSNILGVDKDIPQLLSHGKIDPQKKNPLPFMEAYKPAEVSSVRLLTEEVQVLCKDAQGNPAVTMNNFGSGKAIYMSSYRHNAQNIRLLHKLLLSVSPCDESSMLCSEPDTECHVFCSSGKLVFINNAQKACETSVILGEKEYFAQLEPFGFKMLPL